MLLAFTSRLPTSARERVLASRAGLALAPLLWSGNFVLGRALRDEIGALELNVWRWTIALAVLLPFTVRELRSQWGLLRRQGGFVLALGLTGVAVPHTCVYAALQGTTAVNALLLLSLTPLLIVLGARVLSGEALRPGQGLGMMIAMAGAVVLIVRGRPAALLAFQFQQGELWMLPAVVAGAAQALLLKRTPPGIGQASLLTASIIAALALMLPLLLAFGAPALPATARMLAGLGYTGVLASALAFVLWNRGVARIGPGHAAPYLFLMPLYGSILSLLILGEPLQGFQYAGGALLLFGLWLGRSRGEPSS